MKASDLRDEIAASVAGHMSKAEVAAILPELFMSTQLVLVEDRWSGQPFEMHPMIRDNFIRPLFGTLNGQGTRQYTEGIIGMARKWSKTTTIAGTALTCLIMEPVDGQLIGTVAYDLEQAKKSLGIGKEMVRRNKYLKRLCQVYSDRIYIPDNGSMWRVFPHSSDDVQGEGLRVAIFEEPHTYKRADVLSGVRSGMGARQEPLTLGVTTAGARRDGVLWDWIHGELDPETGLRNGGILRDDRGLYYWYGARDKESIEDRKVWRKYNAPWVTMEYLEDQYARMPRRDFERYHLNRWPVGADGKHSFTPTEIDAASALKSAFTFDEPFFVAIDGAQNGDAFAIILIQRRADGLHFAEYVFDEPATTDDGFYPLHQIEQLIAELYAKYRCPVFIDPSRLLLMAQHLEHEYGVPVIAVKQDDKTMCPACGLIINAVKTKTAHIGGCPKLANHLRNSLDDERPAFGTRFTSEGKGRYKKRIDAATAAAIGAFALETQSEAPLDFSSGGIHSVSL